jgi:hypothetical protein
MIAGRDDDRKPQRERAILERMSNIFGDWRLS